MPYALAAIDQASANSPPARPVLESVSVELQDDLSSDTLKKIISVRTNEDTQILSVLSTVAMPPKLSRLQMRLPTRLVNLSPRR